MGLEFDTIRSFALGEHVQNVMSASFVIDITCPGSWFPALNSRRTDLSVLTASKAKDINHTMHGSSIYLLQPYEISTDSRKPGRASAGVC